MEDLIEKLKTGKMSVGEITDEDLKQLVIYYATLLRSYIDETGAKPNAEIVIGKKIVGAWNSWPRELFERFSKIVITNNGTNDNKNPFWRRAVNINLSLGVKPPFDHM
jgi:hypothetical protein